MSYCCGVRDLLSLISVSLLDAVNIYIFSSKIYILSQTTELNIYFDTQTNVFCIFLSEDIRTHIVGYRLSTSLYLAVIIDE